MKSPASTSWWHSGYESSSPTTSGWAPPAIYVNCVDEANSLIDAARAGLRLARLPAASPVGFFGYSQGSGVAAAAAETVDTRAPELHVAGTYSGAAPADLRAVLEHIDGTLAMGAIGYAVNGLIARYPHLRPLIDGHLTPAGKRFLSSVADQCFADTLLAYGFQRTTSFTNSGQSFAALIDALPELHRAVSDQRIGQSRPNAPVLVHASSNDDAIPLSQDIALYRDWCARGSQVLLHIDRTPPVLSGTIANHGIGAVTGLPLGVQFLVDRFNGVTVRHSCSAA